MKKFILSVAITIFCILNIFAQNDLALRIITKPTPRFTDKQNLNPPHSEGTVRLRVEFLATGEIGKIFPVSELSSGLTENAVDAAKKIRFEPAVKDGVRVTVTKQISYTYQYAWVSESLTDEKAEAIIKRAVEKLGGERYLQVKTQISTGNFTPFREGMADLPNGFIDVISFPDKERTEFKQLGNKIVQTNVGETGWLFDGGPKVIREQDSKEIEGFKRGQRTSLDNLLRGNWRKSGATLTYVGRREAGIGKRNDVVKLTYSDGFVVEYEFDGVDGMPMKSLFKGKDNDGIESKEEERYAQFVNVQGILVPFIIDRYIDGKQQSRINYEKIEFNKNVPDSIFTKPSDVKEFKKDLKL